MSGLFAALPILFAEAAAGGGSPSGLANWLPFLPIPFLLYFLIIRPQQQQEKQKKLLLGALKKNDKVLTAAGIYGTVVSVAPEQNKVIVRIDDDRGTKVAFTTASIVTVLEVSQEKDQVKD